jgi:hypothetical protein
MSTLKPSASPLERALGGIPKDFRPKLVGAYLALKEAARDERHDVAGLNAGKFCEAVVRLLQKETSGSFTPFGKQIPNFADECRAIITSNSPSTPESLRVVVPRALVFVYTMRSKRGIGHVGGDVDANGIDVATMARVADWIVCELIRVYHSLSLEEAQDLVDGLVIREMPEIWEVDGKKRILRNGLNVKNQTLLLLYSEPSSAVLAEDLCSWVEYTTLSLYRRDVLRPMHRARLIEYDEDVGSVRLSPTGTKEAEEVRRRLTSR